MDEMHRQMQEFVSSIRNEVMARAAAQAQASQGAIVPVRHPTMLAPQDQRAKEKRK